MALIRFQLKYGPRLLRVPDDDVECLEIAENTIARVYPDVMNTTGLDVRYEGAWVWSLWMDTACVAHVFIPKFV